MKRFIFIAITYATLSSVPQLSYAEKGRSVAEDEFTWVDFQLSNEPSPSANSESREKPMTSAARIRQHRALLRDQQRAARIEANAWMGIEPLRPSWSSVPMMSSRFPERRTVVIPVYVP